MCTSLSLDCTGTMYWTVLTVVYWCTGSGVLVYTGSGVLVYWQGLAVRMYWHSVFTAWALMLSDANR